MVLVKIGSTMRKHFGYIFFPKWLIYNKALGFFLEDIFELNHLDCDLSVSIFILPTHPFFNLILYAFLRLYDAHVM